MLAKIENIWKALVLNKDKDMAKLNWAMVGGGEGSQIGPAHRVGAQADGDSVGGTYQGHAQAGGRR